MTLLDLSAFKKTIDAFEPSCHAANNPIFHKHSIIKFKMHLKNPTHPVRHPENGASRWLNLIQE
jgi:hypothetical protein